MNSEQINGVGEIILVTESANNSKPVPFALTGIGKEIARNIVQDIARKAANHAKECELLEVEQSFTREATSKEEHNWFWCPWVEF